MNFVLSALLTTFYWLYSRTFRYRHVNRPPDYMAPCVYAHWHGDELLLLGAYPFRSMAVMASRSKDGETMRRLLQWLGYYVVRGSSSRGGAGGLKGLIDAVEGKKLDASLAVDGPRGPIYRVKPGILKLAQQTGVSLVPGAAAASGRFVFKKAWNRCYLPLPFAKCVIVYGDPIEVPLDLEPTEFERLRLRLERELGRLKVEAESQFSRLADPLLLSSSSVTGV